jgi:predicted aconitase with swiveling domain
MIPNSGRERHGRALSEGEGAGPAVVLTATLSLWGGVDPKTGVIIDPDHPQLGTNLAGKVVVLPGCHGSCAGATIVLESLRRKTSPVAWLLTQPTQILLVGALIAQELYGIRMPVVLLDKESAANIHDGEQLRVDAFGDDAIVKVA